MQKEQISLRLRAGRDGIFWERRSLRLHLYATLHCSLGRLVDQAQVPLDPWGLTLSSLELSSGCLQPTAASLLPSSISKERKLVSNYHRIILPCQR